MNPGINAASAIRQDGTTLLFVGKIILEFQYIFRYNVISENILDFPKKESVFFLSFFLDTFYVMIILSRR